MSSKKKNTGPVVFRDTAYTSRASWSCPMGGC